MRDRFVRGLIGGLAAGLPTLVINIIFYRLHLSTLRFYDFAGLIILGRKPAGIGDTIFTIMVMMMFYSGLGIIYAYLITWLRSSYYWLKGLAFGGGLWFVFYSLARLYRIEHLTVVPLKTAASNLVGALTWGAVLGFTFNLMSVRWGQINARGDAERHDVRKPAVYRIFPRSARKKVKLRKPHK